MFIYNNVFVLGEIFKRILNYNENSLQIDLIIIYHALRN